MGEKMTLEQVRMQIAALGYNETRARWLETIDAHLTQPAQAVDVGAIREVQANLLGMVKDAKEKGRIIYRLPWLLLQEEADKLAAALPKDSNGAEGVEK